jgi:hypothetical protein
MKRILWRPLFHNTFWLAAPLPLTLFVIIKIKMKMWYETDYIGLETFKHGHTVTLDSHGGGLINGDGGVSGWFRYPRPGSWHQDHWCQRDTSVRCMHVGMYVCLPLFKPWTLWSSGTQGPRTGSVCICRQLPRLRTSVPFRNCQTPSSHDIRTDSIHASSIWQEYRLNSTVYFDTATVDYVTHETPECISHDIIVCS